MINITEIKQQVLDFVKAFVKKVHGQDQAQKITRQSFIDKIKQAGFDINPSSFRTFFAKLEKIADADNIESAVFNNSKYIKALVMQQIIIAICPALQYVLSGNPIELDPKKVFGLEEKSVSATNEESDEVDESRGKKRLIEDAEIGPLFQFYFNLLRVANCFKDIAIFKNAVETRTVENGAAIRLHNTCYTAITGMLREIENGKHIQDKTIINACFQNAKTLLEKNNSYIFRLNNLKLEDRLNEGDVELSENFGNREVRREMDELYFPALWTIYAVELYITLGIMFAIISLYGILTRYKIKLKKGWAILQFKLKYEAVDKKKIKQAIRNMRKWINLFLQKDTFENMKNFAKNYEGHLRDKEPVLKIYHADLAYSLNFLIVWFRMALYGDNTRQVSPDKFLQEITIAEDFLNNLQVVDNVFSNTNSELMMVYQNVQIEQPQQVVPECSIKIDFPDYDLGIDLVSGYSYWYLINNYRIANNPNIKYLPQQVYSGSAPKQSNGDVAQESGVPAQSQVLVIPDTEPVSAEVLEPSIAEEILPDKQMSADPPTVEETGSQEITDLPNTEEAISSTEPQEQYEVVDPVQSYNEEEDVPAPVYTQPDMSSQSAEETTDTRENPVQEEPQPQVAPNPFMQPVYLDMMGFNYMPNQNPAYDEYMRAMSNYGSVDGYIPDEPSQDIPAGGGYIPR